MSTKSGEKSHQRPPGASGETAGSVSDRLLANALDSSASAVAITDVKGALIYVNPACLKLWGCGSISEVLGMFAKDFWADPEKSIENFKIAKKGGVWSGEMMARRKDGTAFPSAVSINRVKGGSGGEVHLMAAFEDITARKSAEKKLGDSEERYRRIIETSGEGILTLDGSFNVVSANRQFSDMLGYGKGEAVGAPSERFVHPEDLEMYRREKTSRARGALGRFELRLLKKDGGSRWFSISATPLYAPDGSFAGSFSMLADVDDRKRAEEALRESEGRYRALVEEATEAIAVFDLDLDRFVDFNRNAEKLFRRTREELLEHGALEFYSPVQPDGRPVAESFREHQKKCSEGGPTIFERVIRPADGTERYCEVRLVGLPSKDRRLIRTSYIDITERKRVEVELRKSEAQLSNAMRMAKLGFWELDVEKGKFTFSDSFYTIFRTTAGEMGGYLMPIADYTGRFVHPDDAPLVEQETRKAMETDDPGYSRYLEHRIRYADGGAGHIGVLFFIVKDPQGKTVKTYGVNQDITERKMMETEKAKLEEQLRHSQKMESVGRLAGGVAHDFNNLLTGITGNIQLALMDMSPDDPLYSTLKEINGAADSAAGLTRQLLAFSKKQISIPKVLDLRESLDGMGMLIKRIAGEDVEVTITHRNGPRCRIRIDPTQLEQIIVNLAVNARQAMSDGGRLEIETSDVSVDPKVGRRDPAAPPGEYVTILVSDTGCGMSDEVKQHLFEPFFTTRADSGGTGLGLSTVYGIVRQNGGSIEAESKIGAGTTFRILLPRTDAEAVERPPEAVGEPIPKGRGTIVLVEDEPLVREVALRTLKKAGYRVLHYPNGGEALMAFEKYPCKIDLLVTDVVMPGMNGKVLADRFESIQHGLKVLFTSGYTDDALVERGMPGGGFHFLGKPYTPQHLARKVREVLDARA